MLGMFRIAAVVGCALVFALPHLAGAQHTADDEERAIQAVREFLKERGETAALAKWNEGWKQGARLYSFVNLPASEEARVKSGDSRIEFSTRMVDQILSGRSGVDRAVVADWAATFTHELVHTTQTASGWVGAENINLFAHSQTEEAAGWGKGHESYWKWLAIAYRKSRQAATWEQREQYAMEAVELAASFQRYADNYRRKQFGPIPKHIEFIPFLGTDTFRLTLEEALEQAEQVRKSLSANLHVVVKLNKSRVWATVGEQVELRAIPDYGWGGYTYIWKVGNQTLAAKGQSLIWKASVNETITVTVQDNHRGQKASASCEFIIVHGPTPLPPVPPSPPPTPAPTTKPTPKPATGTYAWVHVDTRINDWQTRLDAENARTKGWKYGVAASANSVTITNTYTGSRTDAWMKNGMSESGTATWSAPPALIRSGDVATVDLTVTNAPRSHSNFFGIISIRVAAHALRPDGSLAPTSSSFANADGRQGLGAGIPKSGNQPKTTLTLTVSRKFGAGAAPGDKMSIVVTASGVSQSVQTAYVYEWRQQ
jgi:hypothetical protein